MTAHRPERRLAAILVADVVGYSRLMGCNEDGTLSRLTAHRRELIEPLVAKHHGRVVNFAGDSVLCEFPRAVDAIEFAVAMQRTLVKREGNAPEGEKIRFRVGVHVGEVVPEGDDLYGDTINVAARLERLAEPGPVTAKVCVLAISRIGGNLGGDRRISREFLALCRSSCSLLPVKIAALATVLSSNSLPIVLSVLRRVVPRPIPVALAPLADLHSFAVTGPICSEPHVWTSGNRGRRRGYGGNLSLAREREPNESSRRSSCPCSLVWMFPSA